MTEEEYDLNKSAKKLGKLYPILKDAHGNIIDGFHRQNADPDWQSIKVDSVTTPAELELARLATNFCRRTLKDSEIQNRLVFLIGKCGMKPEEIAEATGIHVRTIYRYMPQELKNETISKSTSEAKSEIARQSLTTVTPSIKIRDNGLVECEIGKHLVDQAKAKKIEGHIVCEMHEEIAKRRFKPQPEKPLETKEYKPTDTWEYRKAHMTPQHSKMEEQVLTKLVEKGIRNISQNREFALLTTTPDYFLPSKNIAIYLDGKDVHQNRTDRDERLREMLEHRGIKVYSIMYESTSEKEIMRITKAILDYIA
jgi:very-short-patch-repair endonuclease